ncbi:uncharacterized protein LOC109600906 [Aethina tumida]|uniref:uncharacterized protein LOC109600906 n=1 Tax=Aethina tumida TaxID=116153 RepID=UPI00096B336D|nr:uncharacterized protein LOC109600906 [Aethina tumida]
MQCSASATMFSAVVTVLLLTVWITLAEGACTFKKEMRGRWFQSGVQNVLLINASYMESKGECYEESVDKYLVYDRHDDCYRCMAIHVKHSSVLQYKETYCEMKSTMTEICYGITGDAPLYSMFRKYPETKPIPCPFKSAPFTFAYNRGAGECGNPPSKAESCTDDSRMVFKYQACPDIPSSESNVDELICLALWKEGSTRYLIGKMAQGGRRSLTSDEDQYRCFIYQRGVENGKVVYNIAQSADASCSGMSNAFEGSRTMKLTTVDNHHNRCKFPEWITDHHTWLSLDHHKTYRFSQRNATLKILDDDPPKINKVQTQAAFAPFQFGFESQDQRRNSEMRVVCHSILQALEHKKVQIVAHVTSGCDSGYVCMVFYKRDSNVIELQQSDTLMENEEACANFDPSTTPFTTLITTNLHTKKCPHLGKYSVQTVPIEDRRKKRDKPMEDMNNIPLQPEEEDCDLEDYQALSVGCSGSNEMEFKTSCRRQSLVSYQCHGNWKENDMNYIIASPLSRKTNDALRYCFIYQITSQPQSDVVEGTLGRVGPPVLRLSGATDSCHRHIVPGVTGSLAFNFTSNGTCAEYDAINASPYVVPTVVVVLVSSLVVTLVWR